MKEKYYFETHYGLSRCLSMGLNTFPQLQIKREVTIAGKVVFRYVVQF